MSFMCIKWKSWKLWVDITCTQWSNIWAWVFLNKKVKKFWCCFYFILQAKNKTTIQKNIRLFNLISSIIPTQETQLIELEEHFFPTMLQLFCHGWSWGQRIKKLEAAMSDFKTLTWLFFCIKIRDLVSLPKWCGQLYHWLLSEMLIANAIIWR